MDERGAITSGMFSLVLATAVVTMMLTPLALQAAPFLIQMYRRWRGPGQVQVLWN